MLTRSSWVGLALLHGLPALVLFRPDLVQSLYGVAPDGPAGVLLVHRGALFLAVLVAALYAVFVPEGRRLATLVVGISVVGFLLVYVRAGWPTGALRKIAVADLFGVPLLIFAIWQAWR